jgi:hypothetical protein
MERYVNDPSITHVLMFCDRLYCEKANQRRGGVGKETQIISAEVYERVGESKSIPIFCELFDDGSPCLPTYLRSRFAIDFSSETKVDENWETLIRALFGQPLYQKPVLGTPPAYITTPQEPSRPSASKFLSWRQAMNRGSTAAPLLSHQYFESLSSELQQFYLTHSNAEKLEIEFDGKFQRLKRVYVVPTQERSSWGNVARFTIFYAHSEILQNKKNRQRLNRYDLLADSIKERCGTSLGVFQSVMEADLLLALRSILHRHSYLRWYPRTLIYSPHRVLPLFARAEQYQQFQELCELVGVTDKQELQQSFLAAVQKEPNLGTLFSGGWNPTSLAALINLERLDTIP